MVLSRSPGNALTDYRFDFFPGRGRAIEASWRECRDDRGGGTDQAVSRRGSGGNRKPRRRAGGPTPSRGWKRKKRGGTPFEKARDTQKTSFNKEWGDDSPLLVYGEKPTWYPFGASLAPVFPCDTLSAIGKEKSGDAHGLHLGRIQPGPGPAGGGEIPRPGPPSTSRFA